jgi:release factor glutamine methyltransferase
MSESIAETLLNATRMLSAAGVDEARLDAGLLLANLLGQDRTFLITHSNDLLNEEHVNAFQERVQRRMSGEPLQYITGVQEFYGLTFEVNSATLIPRPETELLVESALEAIDAFGGTSNFLDVGTGTGCITIALLNERPEARATAIDASFAAIQLAIRNARRHLVSARVSFLVTDAFSAFSRGPNFDLIVSNPPYIPDAEWATLQREVRDHEPRLALTSGSEGLEVIRRLLAESAGYLGNGGYLLFEMGYNQREAIERLIDQQEWKVIAIRPDLQQIPRIVWLQKR